MQILRQGDVLLKSTEPPVSIWFVGKFTSYVLAKGEKTGHEHILTCEPNSDFEILKDEKNQLYVRTNNDCLLIHPEHKPLKVVAGSYIVLHEKEYDYITKKIKKIKD